MATPFTFESAADGITASGGGEVSLALDRAGNPRIAFSQDGSGQIIVAQRNGGTWTHESVPGGLVGRDVRAWLAIDFQGNPQLGYQDLNGGDLIHAVKSSAGQWSFSHIPTRLTPGHPPGDVFGVTFALHPGRLDPDSRDAGYFAYVDPTTDGIGFAHTGSVGPLPTPVQVQFDPTDLTTFAHPAIAFDPSENFFIAYVGYFHTGSPQDDVSVRLTHVLPQGTFSQPQAIEGPSPFVNVRRPPSIARTFSGGCVAYFDSASRTLKASVTSGGVSGIETVATNINNIVTPSASSVAGDFRIAYADADAVKLASRSPSGVWTVEAVDAVSAGSPSLAYDNAATAHIAYAAGGRLKYARRPA
jgi:hypothetical protein